MRVFLGIEGLKNASNLTYKKDIKKLKEVENDPNYSKE